MGGMREQEDDDEDDEENDVESKCKRLSLHCLLHHNLSESLGFWNIGREEVKGESNIYIYIQGCWGIVCV
jgi:hypothetical protein